MTNYLENDKMNKLNKLKIKLFADGADFDSIKLYNNNPIISGFTTNPSLMKSAGVTDYNIFAKKFVSNYRKTNFIRGLFR